MNDIQFQPLTSCDLQTWDIIEKDVFSWNHQGVSKAFTLTDTLLHTSYYPYLTYIHAPTHILQKHPTYPQHKT